MFVALNVAFVLRIITSRRRLRCLIVPDHMFFIIWWRTIKILVQRNIVKHAWLEEFDPPSECHHSPNTSSVFGVLRCSNWNLCREHKANTTASEICWAFLSSFVRYPRDRNVFFEIIDDSFALLCALQWSLVRGCKYLVRSFKNVDGEITLAEKL